MHEANQPDLVIDQFDIDLILLSSFSSIRLPASAMLSRAVATMKPKPKKPKHRIRSIKHVEY